MTMERLSIVPRCDWREKVESVGMYYHTIDGEFYWDESACYRFNRRQVETIESVTAELHSLCLNAVEEIIRRNLFSKLCIPQSFVKKIIHSWEMDEPSLYGRFDLAWDGSGPPKLLEYNADTPTSLLEASVVQWYWLKDCRPAEDQFNSIHEKLIAFWENWPYAQRDPVHFACASGSLEDFSNLEYLRDTAVQGGMETRRLFMEEIGWDHMGGRFVGVDDEPIRTLFKLYPWEWMAREKFGPFLANANLHILEPAWKMVLSNKGILPILWELFEGHPHLLQASFGDQPLGGDYVRKPLFSREGGNVEIHRAGKVIIQEGSYGKEGYIYQRYCPLPVFEGNHPVIGSWVIDHEPAGIGIREDTSEITANGSRFVPHFLVEE